MGELFTVRSRLTDADLPVAIEARFTSTAVGFGRVVTNSVSVTLILTRPTSVDCQQTYNTNNNDNASQSKVDCLLVTRNFSHMDFYFSL